MPMRSNIAAAHHSQKARARRDLTPMQDWTQMQKLQNLVPDHLLSQVVLVLGNTAVPSGDGFVLTHHDVLGNLVEQSK